jgi:hypothetical protein
MAYFTRRLFYGLLIVTLAAGTVWAQATAQISGTVRDQTGAVLPGVEVTATQTETGITRTVVTNETGSFVLSNLPLGPYRLESALPGFRTFVQTGIVLQVNSSPVVNPVLEVGQVTEQVEVQANAALVETRSSAVGQVVENERILELPLNGRNVQDLISLAGGAVQQATVNDRMGSSGAILAVAGGTGYSTDFTLDGASHLNFLSGTNMPMPFPDATQEFKVETSGLTAQNGRSAAVGAVTKSGTNQFHGDLFWFVRNDLFNARNYTATKNSTLKRNQFGGVVGGPIVQNKLFFFGGYQGTTLRQDPADNEKFVPTAAMMAGDWTAFASPACNGGRAIALRPPFVNNRIDPALYSRAAVNLTGRLPKAENECGRVQFGSLNVRDDEQYVGKIDYQISGNHSLFGRLLVTHLDNPDPMQLDSSNVLNSAKEGNNWLNQSYTIGDTYLIGSNVVQSFRLAVNRGANHLQQSPYFNWCDVGVNMHCFVPKNVGSTSVAGGWNIGTSFAPGHYYINNSYSANDDVSWVKGSHQVGLGGSALHGRQNNFAYFAALGQFTFSGQTTGIGMGDFLLGRPSRFFQGAPNAHVSRATYLAMYVTDTWKMTPKFTLNYGVRWDPYLPQRTGTAPFWASMNFDYERFRQGIKSNVFVNAPAGMYFSGDQGFPGETGNNTKWWQFAPRVGFAWSPTADGKTSIRAAYSFGYAFVPGDFKETYSGMPPWGNRVTLTSIPGGFDSPWTGIAGGNPFPYVLDKNVRFAPVGFFYTQNYDTKTPNSQSWNLTLQQEVAPNWLASAGYIGTAIRHIWGSTQLNPAIYMPGASCVINGVSYTPCSSTANTDQRRRFSLERPADGALMGFVAHGDDGGKQGYHGMLLSIERRAAQGVTVNANYTWSHCVGPLASVYNPMGANANITYTDPNNRDFDQGNCDADRRHVLNLTSVAQTPQFANPTLRMIATGWRLSGLYRWSTGAPLNITSGQDRALNGISDQRANQIVANPATGKSGPLDFFLNPSAFVLPDLGTLGNVGRNSIQGPDVWSFDMALSRAFNVREAQRIEFRAEAFNVTNSFRPVPPATALSSNVFGQIRNSMDPRILQFALKYIF